MWQNAVAELVYSIAWAIEAQSGLGHDILSASDLALHLFAGPACRLYSARLEFAIGLGLLDHSGEPFLAEKAVGQLAVRESICQVAIIRVSKGMIRVCVTLHLPNHAHARAHK